MTNSTAAKLRQLANGIPFFRSRRETRIRQIIRADGPIGKFSSALSCDQKKYIQDRIVGSQMKWRDGRTPAPLLAETYSIGIESKKPKISIVMSKYINCVPEFIANDFTIHFFESARRFGAISDLYYADGFTYIPAKNIDNELSAFSQYLSTFRPEVVVIDSNYVGAANQLNARHLRRLKERFSFKVICVIGDLYDSRRENCLSAWDPCADLFVIFNKNSKHFKNYSAKHKVLVCPGMPYSENLFYAASDRDIEFYYCGSRSRQRDIYLKFLEEHGNLNVYARFHDRRAASAPSTEIFLEEMGRAKMTFGNGYIKPGMSIITGRIAESILSKALLFYEAGSDIDRFLVPFVHYIPVKNAHELGAFSTFFSQNALLRETITGDAFSFWAQKYSSKKFWAAAMSILYGGDSK